MKVTLLTSVFALFCCISMSSALGDDCDPAFVASQISELESRSDYKDCQLANMKQSYLSSSHELVQFLDLLKDNYRQSLASNGDDNSVNTKISEYGLELGKANTKILEGNSIDISTAGGKQRLLHWTRDVHDYLKDPKRKIDGISPDSLASPDKLMLCKAKFQWKISQKWHQRIIHCINKAEHENRDNNTGAANDNTTPGTE